MGLRDVFVSPQVSGTGEGRLLAAAGLYPMDDRAARCSWPRRRRRSALRSSCSAIG